MRLGLALGYTGARVQVDVQAVQDAERLGYHSVWTAEAYGSDAVVPLAWLGALTYRIRLGTAILQMAARTPAMTAMTAMTLDALSGGRALLGLGVSGPQVVEGWHGQPFGKPLGRTREYVVDRPRDPGARAAARARTGSTTRSRTGDPAPPGSGSPSGASCTRAPTCPIYLAAIGPKNVALAAEIADGWLPVFFSPERAAVFHQALAEGFDRAGAPGKRERFDVAPMAPVVVGRDVDACRGQVKPRLALYVGGMGARGRNFYFDLACRYGYEAAATRIQEFYLAGRRPEAEAAVPDALVDEVALCGPAERIRERLSDVAGRRCDDTCLRDQPARGHPRDG